LSPQPERRAPPAAASLRAEAKRGSEERARTDDGSESRSEKRWGWGPSVLIEEPSALPQNLSQPLGVGVLDRLFLTFRLDDRERREELGHRGEPPEGAKSPE